MAFCIILNMIIILGCGSTVLGEIIVRQSKNGLIRGNITENGNLTAQTYLGIPYAEPPTGDWRFKAPRPKNNWNGTLDAFKFGNQCPQIRSVFLLGPIDEDCLFLNIYVPGQVNQSDSLAVMVFVHGGSYTSGSGNTYNGQLFALTGNVIIVTMNYRLGLLGFLSTGNDAARGNYGLLDQQLAFRWVHENVAYFGGDSKQVTIFGESAGAASVSLQAISPTNVGLFQRVISQSGTALSPWTIEPPATMKYFISIAASKLGCPNNDTSALVQCFRKLDVDKIISNPILYIAPVVDGDFLPDSAADIFIFKNASKNTMNFVKSIDHMIGCNNQEGGLLFLTLNQSIPNATLLSNNPDDDKRLYLTTLKAFLPPFTNDTTFMEALKQEYKHGNLMERTQMWMNAYADLYFVAPTVMSNFVYSSLKEIEGTYMYYYTQDKASSPLRPSAPSWFKGASHGEELLFLFRDLTGEQMLGLTFTAKENQLSTNMITYWSNFAKTGNPNLPTEMSESRPAWPMYTPSKQQYIHLNAKITVEERLLPERMKFWMRVSFPSLLSSFSPVTPNPTSDPTSGAQWVQTCTTMYIMITMTIAKVVLDIHF